MRTKFPTATNRVRGFSHAVISAPLCAILVTAAHAARLWTLIAAAVESQTRLSATKVTCRIRCASKFARQRGTADVTDVASVVAPVTRRRSKGLLNRKRNAQVLTLSPLRQSIFAFRSVVDP